MVEKTYLETSKQQRSTADVFKYESAFRKVTIKFLDSVNKEPRYGVCISQRKSWKEAVTNVSSRHSAKSKVRISAADAIISSAAKNRRNNGFKRK